MPLPLANVINGGKHAGQENDIQEHMIIPTGAKHIRDAIEMESEIYHYLGKNLKKRFGSSGLLIGDEGGYAPAQLKTMQERFDAMLKAIKQAGYEGKVKLGIDAAASEFFSNGKYTLGGKTYTADKLAQFYED
jgi:enolase